jgi:transcriptional regulator with XRE-family HTH domain
LEKALDPMASRTKKRSNSTSARKKRQIPASDDISSGGIGARLRFLRKQRNMTLEELSEASALTKSYVSKIERGLSVPSISTAMKLAESFSITVSQLLGQDKYVDAVCLVRKGERRPFMRYDSSSKYNYEMLAGTKQFKRMEPYIMRPPLGFADGRTFEHAGEEFIFVLSGKIQVELSKELYELSSGDALYFDAHLPHRTRSLGGRFAEVLVVVNPAS